MTQLPARRTQFVGDAQYRGDADALLRRPGDYALVQRGLLRSVVMACPDGCGETVVINLDPRAGKAWRLDRRGEGPTLYPSVWKEHGCKAHFVVWRGFIVWCERFEKGNVLPPYDQALEVLVLAALSDNASVTAEEVALRIDELVYDVDRAARTLAHKGLAKIHRYGDEVKFARREYSG